MPLPIHEDDEKLERYAKELEQLAAQLLAGRPWSNEECDRAEDLVKLAAAGSHARHWRVDSEAEDRIVDAAAEARGE